MFTVLDGILVVLMLIGLVLGYHRGLFASVPRFIIKIAALCLTFCIAAPIVDNFLAPYFSSLFEQNISAYIVEHCPDINAENATEVLPIVCVIIAKVFNVTLPSASDMDTQTLISEIASAVAYPIGKAVAVVISYVLVFITVYLLLKIMLALLSACCSKGILKVINKFLGTVLGFCLAFIGCCVVTLAVSTIFPEYGNGVIYDFFITVNPLFLIFNIK